MAKTIDRPWPMDATPKEHDPRRHIPVTYLAEQRAKAEKAVHDAARAKTNKDTEDEKPAKVLQQLEDEGLKGARDNYLIKQHSSGAQDKKADQEDSINQKVNKEMKVSLHTREPEQERAGKERAKEKVTIKNGETLATAQPSSQHHLRLSAALAKNGQATPMLLNHETRTMPLTQDIFREIGSCPGERFESGHSLNNVSDTRVERFEHPVNLVSRDPRGELPEESLMEQDWNETRKPKPRQWDNESIDSNDVFIVPGAIKKFIEWWLTAIPDVKSHFLEQNIQGHHHCDVNTETGVLVEPIEYPDTCRSKCKSPVLEIMQTLI